MKNVFVKPTGRWAISVVVVATLVPSTVALYSLFQARPTQQNSSPIAPPSASEVSAVTARGRIEPEGEVIQLSASTTLKDARISQLLVKEGDRVRANQTIAILDNRGRLLAALERTKTQVKIAQARLAQVQAGAKAGEISARQAIIERLELDLRGSAATQEATIARLESELRNAETEYQRHRQLYQEGAISASSLDSKRLAMETAQERVREARATLSRTVETLQEQIKEAKSTLDSVAEVRPTDVQAAQAEVESAIAAVKQAQADLDLAYVQAPKDGQILKIWTWAGEVVGDKGIADLGQTDQMYVVAEVYETDIRQVRMGQQASITSSTVSGELHGKVTQIGLQIGQQRIFSTDPVADVDRRVVEVKIRLNPKDSVQVRELTNLKVEVFINT